MSAISLTEIALKHSIGKLEIPADMASEAARDMRLNLIPYTPNTPTGSFACRACIWTRLTE